MSKEHVRILLVEDNPADVRLVKEMLDTAECLEYELLLAGEFRRALPILERERPQVILLDLGLPDGQALDTLTMMHAAAPDVPIVVLSINGDESLALKALQSGAQDFLVKWEVNGYLLSRALRYAVERKQMQDRLYHLAHHDPLTGLPNRKHFYERLRQCLAIASRHGNLAAFLFMDLNNFKGINDTFGHHIGDQVLKAVAERLSQCVRVTDSVARVGGDEFTLVVSDIDDVSDVAHIAGKVLDTMADPLHVDGHAIDVRTSMGISLYPADGEDIETLIRKADAAMYQAKAECAGVNQFRFYSSIVNCENAARLELEHKLRRALALGQFSVYYQPQLDLRGGRLIGMEALLRWRHPEEGMLAPARFLSVLEQTGLIVEVGEWVLREACARARAWQAAGLPPLRMCVNVSAVELREKNFVYRVAAALEETGLNPNFLELEFTEATIEKDDTLAASVLQELHKIGVRLAIDNVGAGAIALKHLVRLPVHAIKLDRSIVHDMTSDDTRAAVIKAIIGVAHVFRMRGLAEGVETAEQMEFLRNEECDDAQGYVISQPLTAEACLEFLRHWHDSLPNQAVI